MSRKALSLCSSINIREHVSYPYKTKGKIIVPSTSQECVRRQAYNYVTNRTKYPLRSDHVLDIHCSKYGAQWSSKCGLLPSSAGCSQFSALRGVSNSSSHRFLSSFPCEEWNASSFTAIIEFFDCSRNSFDVPARGSRSVQEVPCPLCNLKVH